MPDKPPFYEQETNYSCAAACLRMVLASFGIFKPEEEIRVDCDCTLLGTDSDNLVKAARKYRFTRSRKDYLNLTSLQEYIEQGIYPIVYIGVRAYPRPQEHAVVVVEISETSAILHDPERGEISISIEDFEERWNYMRRLTILIEK